MIFKILRLKSLNLSQQTIADSYSVSVTNQSTMDKLIEMRLTAMADAFRSQLNDPKFKEIPFEDQFGMLVDIEYSSRKNNCLKRLIKNAGFDQPEANIIDINHTSGRKLTRN